MLWKQALNWLVLDRMLSSLLSPCFFRLFVFHTGSFFLCGTMSTVTRLSLKSGNVAAGSKRGASKAPPMKNARRRKPDKDKNGDDDDGEEDVVMVEPGLFDEDTSCGKCAVSFRSVVVVILECCSMTLRHSGFWTALGFRQL